MGVGVQAAETAGVLGRSGLGYLRAWWCLVALVIADPQGHQHVWALLACFVLTATPHEEGSVISVFQMRKQAWRR